MMSLVIFHKKERKIIRITPLKGIQANILGKRANNIREKINKTKGIILRNREKRIRQLDLYLYKNKISSIKRIMNVCEGDEMNKYIYDGQNLIVNVKGDGNCLYRALIIGQC